MHKILRTDSSCNYNIIVLVKQVGEMILNKLAKHQNSSLKFNLFFSCFSIQ